MPGMYNDLAEVQVTVLNEIQPYDMFNLTTQDRSQFMQNQFQMIEARLLEQCGVEAFEEYGLPVQDCIRVSGRIVNLSTDDGNLSSDQVGLFNLGDDNSSNQIYKLKLNLSETKQFTLHEGEVVVAEGFNDSHSRFNVNRLIKPAIQGPNSLFDYQFLYKCQ